MPPARPDDREQIRAARTTSPQTSGSTAITITPTHPVADGVHSAVIRAARP